MRRRPTVCILKADGINCEVETHAAFLHVGAIPEVVLVNDLLSGRMRLSTFDMLVIPGGFSYGDDIASGQVLAIELVTRFDEMLRQFFKDGKLMLGICNGFQVLVRAGLLPRVDPGVKQMTLAHNKSGDFECRMVELVPSPSPCIYTRGITGPIELPSAHAEGDAWGTEATLRYIEENHLVPLRYGNNGVPTQEWPANPNGSQNAIAMVCDETGCVAGLMPHPERYIRPEDHPNWRRLPNREPAGIIFFRNAVDFLSH